MEEKILFILKKVFCRNDIDWSFCQSNSEEWDSMKQLDIVVELETEFGISLEPDEMAEIVDCDSILRMVEKKRDN